VKIYHTKRSNGLNESCYYVLQPFKGELTVGEEIIVSVDEEMSERWEYRKPMKRLNLRGILVRINSL
jgi:hypothetical protein